MNPLSSAEALVFLGFNITMRYISLHFTWRILEHERSRWAKEIVSAIFYEHALAAILVVSVIHAMKRDHAFWQ
jgi:hypothetical protein